LIRRFKAADPDIECVGFGGPKMAEAGCDLHYDLTQKAVMFLKEVIGQLRFFFSLVDQADEYFANNEVDAVVLIDYPGFNWWIARKAKARGIPVFYFGVPQMWAWAPWRVRKMRNFVDHALCKLPFEEDWFKKRNVEATYVGHPYFDQLDRQSYDGLFLNSQKGKQLITLLPGSRNREVENNLPTLIRSAALIAKSCPETSFAVASANHTQMEMGQIIIDEIKSDSKDDFPLIELHVNRTPELMTSATACMACSGSVSLELMHHRKPTVIVYKMGRMISIAQSFLLRTRFITLVNLIAVKDIAKKSWRPADPDSDSQCAQLMVMPEYLSTGDVSAPAANQIINWLKNPDQLQKRIDQLDALASKYAKPGAVDAAADYILNTLMPDKTKHTANADRSRAA
jgi:lipid-A-disaccharide synthase